MSSSRGAAAGSGDDEGSHGGKRSAYKRLTSAQITQLEKYMLECPHPDESQRRKLAVEIGVEPKQVKFWFQNKRTQIKNQNEKADNSVLRAENERMQHENNVMREALSNVLCHDCGGPPPSQQHQLYMQQMLLENAWLREEHQRVSVFLAKYVEEQVLPPDHELHQFAAAVNPIPNRAVGYDLALGSMLNLAIDEGPSSLINQNFALQTAESSNQVLLNLYQDLQMQGVVMEKGLAIELAAKAMDELVRLLHTNEPFWVPASAFDAKLVLHNEVYEKMFPRANHFHGANARIESSKEYGIVNMSGVQVVDLFLDSEKWANFFPSIVTKAKTIHVFQNGMPETRNGALLMMYEEMHVLSPLVPSREFNFLRCCQQIEAGLWMIADVSLDPIHDNAWCLSRSWRLPSGCMIQDLQNGNSMVTWIEHVEVNDKVQIHRLFKDLVITNFAYGAQRWILELQRSCQRSTSYNIEQLSNHDRGGVISSVQGKRSLMKLSQRMVKNFCESLNMSGKVEFPQLTVENNNGVSVSVRPSTELGQPNGIIIIAATSLWLPLHYQKVFDFLTDVQKRVQWDVLSGGTPLHKIAHIFNGIYPGNNITIMQPFAPADNNALVVQESFIDPMGSYIVYAPTDASVIKVVLNGEDPTMMPILPSGIVLSRDGMPKHGAKFEGSLLTVVFQILGGTPDGLNQVNAESVASLNTLLTSTVQNIKEALHCNH